jgi:hypothetical protein
MADFDDEMTVMPSPNVTPQHPVLERQESYARVVDTRLEASSSNKVCYVLEEGSNVTSYVPLVSSSHSTTNTTFNLNNIADFTCRDSRMVMELDVTLTLTFQNTNATALVPIQADNFGWKQYPLNRCVQNIQHQINQASYTLNTNDLLDAITKVNFNPDNADFYNNTQPDYVDTYSSASGSNLTPLAPYSNTMAGDGIFKPRSLDWYIDASTPNSIPAESTAQIIIHGKIYEPLISPFNNVEKQDRQGLYAITGELIQLQWVTDLFNNMFAFYIVEPTAPTVPLVLLTKSVSLGQQAKLNCIYLTPKDNLIKEIPPESIIQYNDYTVFTNKIADSLAAGATLNGQSSQVVNFTNLPNKILVYARTANGSRLSSTPDKYLSLEQLTVQFDNGLPQFASANQNQLYDISVRNGLTMPRPSFCQSDLNYSSSVMSGSLYGCGSVFVIDPALDLGIRGGDSVASSGRFIFQVQNANFTNKTDTAFGAITLYVVGINSAVLERVGSQYRNYLLTVPDNVVRMCKELQPIPHSVYAKESKSNLFLYGGAVKDWFRKHAKQLITRSKPSNCGGIGVGGVAVGGSNPRVSRLFGQTPRPAKKGMNLYYQ